MSIPLRIIRSLLIASAGFFCVTSAAQSVGGCDNYAPTEGQTVNCSPNLPTASTGVQSTASTANNNITVNVLEGTVLNVNGSPIGIGSGSTINNYGTLDSRSFFNGYGMSSGANGRSQAGGSTLNNFSTGEIITAGGNSTGIYITATNAGSLGNTILNAGTVRTSGSNANGLFINSGATNSSLQNTITNTGTIRTSGDGSAGIRLYSAQAQSVISNSGNITTTGNNAHGIYVRNTGNIAQITQSGTITVTGASSGIYIQGAAAITHSGTISAPVTAIYFQSSTSEGLANSVKLMAGSVLNGGLVFNTANTQEKLIFDGLINLDFSNSITGLNHIDVIGDSNVKLSSAEGYSLGNSKINVALKSQIEIASSVSDRVDPSSLQTRIEKLGDGLLILSGVNTYTGGTTLSAGTLAIANDQALGTGALTMQADTTLQANANVSVNNTITLNGLSTINTNGQTLTLSGVISGSGSLNKIGGNTLTLEGLNTYAGGTILNTGTLAVSNNQALGTGALTMQADTTLQANANVSINNTISLNGLNTINTNGQTLTLSGVISGTGSLNKVGDDVLALLAVNTYTGNTTVSAGTLLLNGSINSNTSVLSGAILQGSGTINGNVSNFGVIQPSATGNPTNLTIAGNYTSTGGVFVTRLYDSQPNLSADTLTISGPNSTATGATQIGLINTQLLGSPTVGDGILLINATADATTGSNAFYYPGRIAAGAYEYRVIQGGANSPNNWYLRADNTASIETAAAYGSAPVQEYLPTEQAQQAVPQVIPVIVPVTAPITPEPSQRIEVANYPSIPSLARLYMLSTVDSFDQRRNDLAQANVTLGTTQNKTSWGRVLGKAGELRSDDRNQGPGLNARTFAIQLGSDWYRNEASDGAKTFIGPFITLGQASGNTYNSNGSVGTGNVLLQGYSLGLNATHITAQGIYVDSIFQVTRLSGVRANSILGASTNTTGWGITASVETGWKFSVSEHVSLTPQAQLIYNNTQLNDTADFYSNIGIPNDSSLTGRLGIKVAYENINKSGPESQAWLRLSGLSTLAGRNAQIVFQGPSGISNVAFNAQLPANWMSVDAGLNVKLSKSSQLSFTLGYDTSITNAYKGGFGQIGLQVAF